MTTLKQSINLFRNQGDDNNLLDQDFIILYALSALSLVIIILSLLWGSLQSAYYSYELSSNEKVLSKTKNEIDEISHKVETLTNNPEIQRQISELETKIRTKTQLVEFLQSVKPSKPISNLLEGLSHTSDATLQLEKIDIIESGQGMIISGLTKNSTFVTSWLKRLQTNQSFSGIKFDRFFIESDPVSKKLKFEVNSSHELAALPPTR